MGVGETVVGGFVVGLEGRAEAKWRWGLERQWDRRISGGVIVGRGEVGLEK